MHILSALFPIYYNRVSFTMTLSQLYSPSITTVSLSSWLRFSQLYSPSTTTASLSPWLCLGSISHLLQLCLFRHDFVSALFPIYYNSVSFTRTLSQLGFPSIMTASADYTWFMTVMLYAIYSLQTHTMSIKHSWLACMEQKALLQQMNTLQQSGPLLSIVSHSCMNVWMNLQSLDTWADYHLIGDNISFCSDTIVIVLVN